MIGVVSSVADDAHDLAIQGEYTGTFRGPIDLNGKVGLQVVALGKGNFSVRGFLGGLPGSGGDSDSAWELLTSVEEGVLTARPADHDWYLTYHPEGTGRWLVRNERGIAMAGLFPAERWSRSLGAVPPENAKILFNGKESDLLDGDKLTAEGNLDVGAITKDPVQSFQLHLEFRLPFEPTKRGQGRGNSGVYIQRRYEVQILDSFGLTSQFNDCGSLYRQRTPDLNMSLPPQRWQTYDIHFTAAKWNEKKEKIANARITVYLNGVGVHDDVEIVAKTGAGQAEGPNPMPILFQDHQNKVEFRNLWIVEK